MVNVLPPALVVYANHEMTHRIADLVFGAVAQGYPERALACSQGTSAILTLGSEDPRTGQRYVSYETLLRLPRPKVRRPQERNPECDGHGGRCRL